MVLGLLFATLTLLRRKGLAQFSLSAGGSGRKTKQLQVLERTPLTPQHSLHLVRIGRETVVIAASPGGVREIKRLKQEEVDAC